MAGNNDNISRLEQEAALKERLIKLGYTQKQIEDEINKSRASRVRALDDELNKSKEIHRLNQETLGSIDSGIGLPESW